MHCARLTNLPLLLTSLLFFVIKLVDCQICRPGMRYHRHTHTCMIVVDSDKTHEDADKYCANFFSGGHLVYIFDAETNTFITDFLLHDNAWYHIGLNDIDADGVYVWGNRQVANYTKFDAKDSSSHSTKYVTMNKYRWKEAYNYELKFICQTTAEKNEYLFLNGSDIDNNSMETTARTSNVWYCGTVDKDPRHIELFYRFSNRTFINIKYNAGNYLRHVTTPGCNSSGVYVCQITNKFNTKAAPLEGILKVRCKATYCNAEDSNLNLRVHDQTGYTEGKICVFVYPEPTSLGFYKDRSTQNILKSKYNITFSYTDEVSSRGEIDIKLYNMTSSDYGIYYIYVRNRQTGFASLYVNITGPPQCPKNLTSESLGDGMVRLTWSPIMDEIYQQNYVIFKAAQPTDVKMATIYVQNEELVSYYLTGLLTNRSYSFYLQVESGKSVTRCRHLETNILMKDMSA